ncbi:heterokaryon incompatibility protein-domain-containing protein [Rhodocollybia butyracea]|uniref:Heterokaryon incompatibility protein-domain-containing protein n=1 Tax=Rhodocollybia butyracea TaxID=206335 RepID=A0A9P5UER8_9AGAR|nr:heterokaryon incompatibility protein-domain-containing protein [Rhodocollybia butyracea]
MRLIRTTDKDPELVYFASEVQVPKYAILSHVWEEEEVSFQDMQDPTKRKDMKGWSKIVGACKLACSESWEYIWIDTCCIDKSSSSELSEAINSMYRYYSRAQVCYAYLTDVQSDLPSRSFNLAFRICKWFTRGWTLQELIAPTTVVFFMNDWKKIGTKRSLQDIITEITGIPSEVLLQANPKEMSIAARMSWAAKRKTTRIEDRAYSLMGIFGVYMPPIYGEGEHAFVRLQEEILKVSDDQTIFAWDSRHDTYRGILAISPDEFERSGQYEPFQSEIRRPFTMTNIGLLVHLPLLPINNSRPQRQRFLALLNCRSKTSKCLAIYVSISDEHQYERDSSDVLVEDDAILAKCGKIEGSPQDLLFKAWNVPGFATPSFARKAPPQTAVSFSGGQGIRAVRVNDSNGNRPVSAKITGTADYNMGLFTLYYRKPCIFLFIHDPTHRPFVVVAGDGWLDLVLDFETGEPDLEDIQQSYKPGKRRAGMPLKRFDRISKVLTNNVAVLVEEGHQNKRNMLNISIVDKVYLDVAPAVHPVRYVFVVSFSSVINAGFSQLETYPSNVWEARSNDTINLFLDDGSTLGTLCFQHNRGQRRFAVTFGFRDKTTWSDVVNTWSRETAKDICNSYYDNGKRNARTESYALDRLDVWGARFSVRSDAIGRAHNQYKSEIEIEVHS